MTLETPASVMKRLYEKGLTTVSGGNASRRIENGKILITPAGGDKSLIKEEELAVVPISEFDKIRNKNCSTETQMHIAIYKKCPEINALIHAHPPYTTVISCSSEKVSSSLTDEGRYWLQKIDYIPYLPSGSTELANAASEAAEKNHVLILRNHGALTAGKTLSEAYKRMEILEHICFIQNNSSF
ncbi:MAG: class II aldolase/adducin family protein [bacterium]